MVQLPALLRASLQHLTKKCPQDFQFLVACSGGKDSMALVHAFLEAGLSFAIVHVNHVLRGEESREDAAFVASWAQKHMIPFFTKEANPVKPGKNLQESARELRYSFFEEIRLAEGFDFICTAHHRGDWLETAIFNLIRGGLLPALSGIPDKNGHILRPFLHLPQDVLTTFISSHHVEFREDSSNQKSQYARNSLRKDIIPRLKDINPAIEETLMRNRRLWQEMDGIRRQFLHTAFLNLRTIISDSEFLLLAEGIRTSIAPRTLLYNVVQPLGFSSRIVEQLERLCAEQTASGAFIRHRGWIVLRNEKYLRFSKVTPSITFPHLIHIPAEGEYPLPDGTTICVALYEESIAANAHKKFRIALDSSKFSFPFTVRSIHPGDVFYPLGMGNHKKKVKDFLTNLKLDRFARKKVWLLTDAQDHILWVMGFRQDTRCMAGRTTAEFIIFDFKNSST